MKKYPDNYNVYYISGSGQKYVISDTLDNATILGKEKYKDKFTKIYKIEPLSVFRKRARITQQKYYRKNPDKYIATVIRSQKKHPEKFKEINKRYRDRHREEINRKNAIKHSDKYHSDFLYRKKMSEYSKKYRLKNLEKVKLYRKQKYLKNGHIDCIKSRMKNQAFYEIYNKLLNINNNDIKLFCKKIKKYVPISRKPIPLFLENK